MDRKRISLIIASIILAAMFASSMWLITYQEEPLLLGAPSGGGIPYQDYGMALAVATFSLMMIVIWVGAIHHKVDRLKVLNEQKEKGLISDIEFKKKVEELLSQ